MAKLGTRCRFPDPERRILNSLGAILTALFCGAVLILPRRLAALSVVASVCYITQGQTLQLGFNFTAVRLVLLAGFFRVLVKGELQKVRFNAIDKSLVAYAVCLALVATLRRGTSDELVYQLGGIYNFSLSYFFFRALLTSKQEICDFLAILPVALVPLALFMMHEAYTGRNLFAHLGGVSPYSMIRDNHVRAQGSFRSPITAGSLGATFAMLFTGLLFARERRRAATFGLIFSVIILICAHSSGPLLGVMAGLAALSCWRFRQHTRKIRWSIVISLVGLHLVMKSPVWFLMGRISDLVGGGGYHRAYLIDNFVKRFSTWWLAGTSDTSAWMATELSFGGADLTNQFVSDGVNAGLLCLILSIMILVRCFQGLGTAMKALDSVHELTSEKLLWGFGAALVGTIAILFSVTYFDQMHVIWYLLLACIANLASIRPTLKELSE